MSQTQNILVTLIIVTLVVILGLGAFLISTQLNEKTNNEQPITKQASLDQDINLFAMRINDLENENKKLSDKLEMQKIVTSNDGDLYYGDDRKCLNLQDEKDDIKDDLDDVNDDIDDIEAEIIIKTANNETISDLQSKLEDLKDERDDLEDDLDDVKDDQEDFRCYKNYLYK